MIVFAFVFCGVVVVSAQRSHKTRDDCGGPVRSVVWNAALKDVYDIAHLSCKERLELVRFRFGNSNAYIVNGLGSGFCGATGNCPTWVVARVGGRYRIVLFAGSVIRTVEFNYAGNKIPLLGFRGRMGISEHYIGRYRFSGNKYRLVSCLNETVSTDGKISLVKADRAFCQS